MLFFALLRSNPICITTLQYLSVPNVKEKPKKNKTKANIRSPKREVLVRRLVPAKLQFERLDVLCLACRRKEYASAVAGKVGCQVFKLREEAL